MSGMWQIAAGAVAPTLVAVGGFIGSWYSRKTGEEANETADWSAFLKENREWTQDRLEERDKKIKNLEDRMDTILKEFHELRGKYAEAATYIHYAVEHMDKHEMDFTQPPEKVRKDIWRHQD